MSDKIINYFIKYRKILKINMNRPYYSGFISKIYKFKLLSWLTLILFGTSGYAQPTRILTSAEIYAGMERLSFLGSALYVAAHPDDENTKLISYLANEKKAYTTYLSLTRGDGGQNLIGPEISELLGVIRTQELLKARATDNGHQLFSRANDFGYSKNAEETIEIWDTEKVKADVVWAIRKTRPDIIINRFDHLTSGKTHGHHTASAILSYDLFEIANDKNAYPEQLKYVRPWQARRLFFNTSWWFYGSEEKFNKADKTNLMPVDVGVYYPTMGKSNTEVAAESRSNHKCQGFGSTGTRGSSMEYLQILKGDMPPSKSDLFEGINTTWTRVKGGEMVQPLVEKAITTYNFKNPGASIPVLISIRKAIQNTGDPFWINIKTAEVDKLIAACAGLFTEVVAGVHKVTPGDSLKLTFEATSQLSGDILLKSIQAHGFSMDSTLLTLLPFNKSFTWTKSIKVPGKTDYTTPYWLLKPHNLGLYEVEDQLKIGQPESDRALKVDFVFDINGETVSYTKDVVYKYNSPENGATYRPLEIVPALTVKIKEPVYLFPNGKKEDIKVVVHTWKKDQSGKVRLPLPYGWKAIPESFDFLLHNPGENKEFTFSVIPPVQATDIYVHPVIEANDRIYSMSMTDIHYDHIPYQTVLMPSSARFVSLPIICTAQKIAYIMGAGDEIPKCLSQIGCSVEIIQPAEISADKLKNYDALIMGVRAYNTIDELKFKQNEIFDFVKNGGNVVVQYNVSNGLVTKEIAPYPITLSRERVTVEAAPVQILNPDANVVNHPNKISEKDFEGWVQERGLYFPSEWDTAFTPILSCNDPGEKPLEGSLLIARYGAGNYIYTGLSFFRQLVAGVPGAYRLFANLISMERHEKP